MSELKHYGVPGMKWGVRRYQNYDGTRIGAKHRNGSSDEKSVVRKAVAKGTNNEPLGNKVKRLSENTKLSSKESKRLSELESKTWKKTITDKELLEAKSLATKKINILNRERNNTTDGEIKDLIDLEIMELEEIRELTPIERKDEAGHRKKVTYGSEPEGYSAKRQRYEQKLRYDIKNTNDIKKKIELKNELKAYEKESKQKAEEYREWLGNVREYTGNYKNYEPLKRGEKYTNEWINKKTGQVITNKEYYDSFHYDSTKRPSDFVKRFFNR